MLLAGDIVDGERLDEILVKVLDSEEIFNSSLAWRLTVEDSAENKFEVKIWHTHDVDIWWRDGCQYVLKEGRAKHQRDGGIILHSTDDFTVYRPGDSVDILAIGDSHIGRENRPADSGAPYRTARQFVAAMGYAARYQVDAVIHTGDLFDDDPTDEDITIALSGFDILSQNDIPFYFIYGNHGIDVSRTLYDRIENLEINHLDIEGVRINDSLEILGIDNNIQEDFPGAASSFSTSSDIDRRILVVHHEIDPPREEDGIPVGPLCESPELNLDYILSGHLHDPESHTCSGTKIQYLGSTADISTKQNALDQSAWLISVTQENVDDTRVDLI